MVSMNNMSVNIRACLQNHDVCSDQTGLPLVHRDLCFIDVETTGPIIGYHEIIEIGDIRTSANAQVCKDKINFKLLPRYPERLTEMAARVNGYKPDEWQDGKTAIENLQRFV